MLDAREVGLEGGLESVAGVAARVERVVLLIGADVETDSRVDVLRVVRVGAGTLVLGVDVEVAVELRVVREGRVAMFGVKVKKGRSSRVRKQILLPPQLSPTDSYSREPMVMSTATGADCLRKNGVENWFRNDFSSQPFESLILSLAKARNARKYDGTTTPRQSLTSDYQARPIPPIQS